MNFQFNSMFDAENVENTHYIALYRGFVYPLGAPKADAHLKMYLVTSAANAVIFVSNNSNPANKVIRHIDEWHCIVSKAN